MLNTEIFLGAQFLDDNNNVCTIIAVKDDQYYVLYGDLFDENQKFQGKWKYLDIKSVNKQLSGRFIEFTKETYILNLIELGKVFTSEQWTPSHTMDQLT